MAESAAPTADSPAGRPAEGTGQRPITVVIADDQKMVRRGLRVILEAEPGISVVAEADDGAQAVELVRRHLPAVALLDIRMPVLDGLRAARQVIADSPGTRVLILTTFDADEYVYGALRGRGQRIPAQGRPAEQLAPRSAAWPPATPSSTRSSPAGSSPGSHWPPAGPPGRPTELRPLTARELEVLRLVARGLSNIEIARELVVEENTVKTHVSRILMKLGLRDRVQAVVLAYELGFVTPEDRPRGPAGSSRD